MTHFNQKDVWRVFHTLKNSQSLLMEEEASAAGAAQVPVLIEEGVSIEAIGASHHAHDPLLTMAASISDRRTRRRLLPNW